MLGAASTRSAVKLVFGTVRLPVGCSRGCSMTLRACTRVQPVRTGTSTCWNPNPLHAAARQLAVSPHTPLPHVHRSPRAPQVFWHVPLRSTWVVTFERFDNATQAPPPVTALDGPANGRAAAALGAGAPARGRLGMAPASQGLPPGAFQQQRVVPVGYAPGIERGAVAWAGGRGGLVGRRAARGGPCVCWVTWVVRALSIRGR